MPQGSNVSAPNSSAGAWLEILAYILVNADACGCIGGTGWASCKASCFDVLSLSLSVLERARARLQ